MTALLVCGVAGPALFVVVLTVDGWTRAGYSTTHHPVSALSLGRRGWLQVTNFVVSGLLVATSGVGIVLAGHPVTGVLVVVSGLMMVASGIWSIDPMRGYPPGTPAGDPPELSRSHRIHDGVGAGVFLSLPAAAAIAGFTLDGGWAWYSVATAVAQVLLLAVFSRAWDADAPWTGLVQRAMLLVGFTWLALLCLHLVP